MNPYNIYRDRWEKALAAQIVASQYNTFVAMPLKDRFSYRSREIYERVICSAANLANSSDDLVRKFARPIRAGEEGAPAVVITEEIVNHILESHFFIADLTFANPGVLVELGIALGVKPNSRVVLVTQGELHDLHFDIRNNNVIPYQKEEDIQKISEALVNAAKTFERDAQHYITHISRRLSSDAILCLNWYGRLRRDYPDESPSLHLSNIGPYFQETDGRNRFSDATRELLQSDLLWTDYQVGAIPGGDAFGMHATELGWAVINHMWKDLKRPTNNSGT